MTTGNWIQSLLPWVHFFATWLVGIIIVIGVAQNLVAFVQLLVASRSMPRQDEFDDSEMRWHQRAPTAPPISLVAPAHNEAGTVVESTRSMLELNYPHYEVVVVNDGSTDETLSILQREFALRPSGRPFEAVVQHKPIRQIYQSGIYDNLIVVDKENGGKADALNAGINVSRSPLFCAVDADSMLESEALLYAVYPFLIEPDKVIAVGGTIRAANGCRVRGGKVVEVRVPERLLPLLQTVEYIRAFLIARMAMSRMGVLTLISGAFGIFSRNAAIAVGGYDTDTVGEDYELVLRMHRYHIERGIEYEVRSVAEPVCWTEVPERLASLASQRRRWQRGGLETFFRHRRMFLNPAYGALGMIGMSFSFLVDVLGPLAEVLGYILVPVFYFSGVLDVRYALAFVALTFVFGVFISAGSLALEEVSLHRHPRVRDLWLLGLGILVENFGYRQLNNLWRIQGWWEFLRRKKGWGKMVRRGFDTTPAPRS